MQVAIMDRKPLTSKFICDMAYNLKADSPYNRIKSC